jgi:hypothetical protein
LAAAAVDAFDDYGDGGSLVPPQDTVLTADEPRGDDWPPMLGAARSIAILNPAHRTEEVDR